MMKTLVVASMLLASSAFGAVTLTAPASVNQVGTTWTVDVGLNITANEQIDGFSLYPTVSLPGNQDITGRVVMSRSSTSVPVPFDWTNPTYSNKTMVAANPDLGGTCTDVLSGPFITASGKVLTMTFTAPTLTPATQYPITIKFNGVWVDANTLDTGGTLSGTTNLVVPEPISALLLAVGAAFFARRRHA